MPRASWASRSSSRQARRCAGPPGFESGGPYHIREAIHRLTPVGRDRPSAPANVYRLQEGVGDIGFINAVTEPFCGDCDRIRLTADGKIRNCLFARAETDLAALLRAGSSDEDIAKALQADVAAKGPGGCLDLNQFYRDRLPRKMWQIGG